MKTKHIIAIILLAGTIDSTKAQNEQAAFNPELVNKEILIKWNTAPEINNDYFSVQISIHGIDWLDAGIKKADYNGNYSSSDVVIITF